MMTGSRAAVAAAVSAAAATPRKGGAARVGPWRRPCGPPAYLSLLPGDLPLFDPRVLKEAAAAVASRSTPPSTAEESRPVAAAVSSGAAAAAVAGRDGWSSAGAEPPPGGEIRGGQEAEKRTREATEGAAAQGRRRSATTATEAEVSCASSVEFPFFKPREEFCFDRSITWYPPHMHKATHAIDKCFRYVDCVVEVRDARAPFSSSNPFLLSAIKKNCLRLVLLNKADLVSKREALRAQAAIEELGTPCLLTCAPALKRISNITSFVLQHCSGPRQQQESMSQQQQQEVPSEQQQQVLQGKRSFKTIGKWVILVGLPNTGKSSVLNAMKKVALNAAHYGRPNNKIVEGVKRTRAKEGRSPGVTREVSAYQISNQPRVYCYDTPGVMLPKMKDPETNLKLAALGCVDDHVAGEMYVADYVLFLLNRMRRFDYVRALDLSEPSNDIQEVAHYVAEAAYGLKVRRRRCPPPPDVLSGCRLFLQFFRNGLFGRCCLDLLPLPACMHFSSPDSDAPAATPLTLDEALREPPGPWEDQHASRSSSTKLY